MPYERIGAMPTIFHMCTLVYLETHSTNATIHPIVIEQSFFIQDPYPIWKYFNYIWDLMLYTQLQGMSFPWSIHFMTSHSLNP